jgi:hypothetical protein
MIDRLETRSTEDLPVRLAAGSVAQKGFRIDVSEHMGLEAIGAVARMGATGPGAMKSLPGRIGRRIIGGLLDVAGTNWLLGSLVNDQAVDFAPPDGMGYTIGIPFFQHVVRDIAECAQWTAHQGERGDASSETWLADEDDKTNEGLTSDEGSPGDTAWNRHAGGGREMQFESTEVWREPLRRIDILDWGIDAPWSGSMNVVQS